MNWIDEGALYSQIGLYLREDLGHGDITTQSIVVRNTRARARFVAGENMIVAGLEAAEEVFLTLDSQQQIEAFVSDGEPVEAGKVIARMVGFADVLISARRVAPTGKAIGIDMTDEMLALARQNAAAGGVANVEFIKGYIEDIPLDAESIDVVISNCVINLSTDKSAVLDEIHRVLRPGGRVGITDIVANDSLTPAQRAERGNWVGCIAGALSYSEYRVLLEGAGFEEIALDPTHEATDGIDSVIIKARKPSPTDETSS